MGKWINAEQQVTVTVYDSEHEERFNKSLTVEEMLDAYTHEGCPPLYLTPERKKGNWVYYPKSTTQHIFPVCSNCGYEGSPTNFCPCCGFDMRG